MAGIENWGQSTNGLLLTRFTVPSRPNPPFSASRSRRGDVRAHVLQTLLTHPSLPRGVVLGRVARHGFSLIPVVGFQF